MHILDDKSDKKLNTVSLFLTRTEALHLIGYLEQLIDNTESDHSHLMSEDHKNEMTICLYGPSNMDRFSPRIQKLIRYDE